jgi:hypothetical protein
MVFMASGCVTYRYVSWEGDFSGYRISERQNARRRCGMRVERGLGLEK